MKQVALVAMAVVVLVAVSGCGGPFKVTRGFDDWMNQKYVENPWLYGNVISTSLAQMVYGLTSLADMVVLNTIDFWGTSAWPFGKQGHGTPFSHKSVTIPK